ncbi:AraC family transcriptional regulator [Tenacibaculum litopenaei]
MRFPIFIPLTILCFCRPTKYKAHYLFTNSKKTYSYPVGIVVKIKSRFSFLFRLIKFNFVESLYQTMQNNNPTLQSLFDEASSSLNCGLVSKKHALKSALGTGYLVSHSFDGLHLEYFQGSFNENTRVAKSSNINALEISFLVQGEKIVQCTKKEMVQSEQEGILYFSNNLKGTIQYYKDLPYRELTVRFYYEFIKKHQLITLFPKLKKYTAANDNCINFSTSFCPRTQEILTDLFTNEYEGLLKRLFLESRVLELVSLQLQQNPNKQAPQSLVKKMYTVKNLIAKSLGEQLSVKELSKRVLLNDTVLKKEFKRVFEVTISEYSQNLRMEKAKELLLHTTKPIYEVSDLVGYKNPTHFSAAFKRFEHLTPKQFRSTYCKV